MKNKQKNLLMHTRLFGLLIACLTSIAPAHAGWEVTWIDKFEGTGVDWTKWTAQIPANYNNEIQCYTDDDSSANRNYEVSDGTLKIIARRQQIDCPGLGGQNRSWTSGRLNSKDKGEFLYGRVEARLRFLELKGGTWPAFWMLENRISEYPIAGDDDTINWPNPGAGEIDVWEWYANSGGQYITNFFNVGSCGSEIRPSYQGGANDVLEFQRYAIEWTADNIKFFMNDDVVAEHDLSSCSQYEEAMFILLNVAIGGNLGGAVDPSLDLATMEVDYVAHCVASDANEFTQCNEQTPLIADDDGDGVRNADDQCPNTPVGTPVDNSGCPLATQPSESAQLPSLPESEVISLYSDAYSNITNIDYNPNWGQATEVNEIQIAGDNVLQYSELNYQGTDFESNPQDVSNMDFVHVDYWTHNANSLKFFLISPGPQERAYTFDVVQQDWQSHKIPLSHFMGVDLTNLFQLKVEGNGTVYFDNIYFSQQAEVNLAPSVTLNASQDSEAIDVINRNGGTVTVSAQINDENSGDTHTINWTANGLTSFTDNGIQVTFNPSDLNDNRIMLTASVTDSGTPSLSAQTTINLPMPGQASVDTPAPVEDSSGGGAFNLMLLLCLTILTGLRRRASLILIRPNGRFAAQH